MNIEKYIVALLTTILMLSMAGMANENTENVNITEKVNITIVSKNLDIDKDSNREIVSVYINSSKIGHLNYIEKYYSINETGEKNLDSAMMYYNNTMPNNTFALKIKRPLDRSGNPYRLIKAMIFIDNKKVFDKQLIFVKNENSSEKKSPGFDIIVAAVSIIFIIYLFKKKRN